MTITEKINRLKKINEELETIGATLDSLRYLAGTVNEETTNRCFAIAINLGDRIDLLYEEFQRLSKEFDEFSKGDGV